jgi:hypothetical protein
MGDFFGKGLLIIGIVCVILGVILLYFKNLFSWFGHLPGDIRIEKENMYFFFPVTSLILISVVINIILWLIRKWKGG